MPVPGKIEAKNIVGSMAFSDALLLPKIRKLFENCDKN